MGKIKSAWEIALEKTENIVIDENKIRHSQRIDSIRRIAGAFLLSDVCDLEKTKRELEAFDKPELKEGLTLTILNGLVLPSDEIADDRYDRLKMLLDIVVNDPSINELFEQLTGLLKQYPLHKKQLMEQMKEQFEPMLREKEEQMKEQYGQEVHLSLETDKEFLQVARQNIDKLESQYQKSLDSGKEQLKQFLS